jgi:hypothetical protein
VGGNGNGLRIDAYQAGEYIANGSAVSSSGGNISSTTIYSRLKLVAVQNSANEWVWVGLSTGTWTVA